MELFLFQVFKEDRLKDQDRHLLVMVTLGAGVMGEVNLPPPKNRMSPVEGAQARRATALASRIYIMLVMEERRVACLHQEETKLASVEIVISKSRFVTVH
jgi:hypothetical protein